MKEKINSITYHTFVILFGFAMLYPIIWLIVSSLKQDSEIFANAASLLITSFEFENYTKGWQGSGGQGFDVFFRNSAFVTTFVVIGTLFSSSLVAFGFARIDFKFRKLLFACLLATVMLPMQVTLIPQYILFHNLGWVNTYLPLIVPAFVGGIPFFIFLMIQFIRGIPRELDEAAVMDGCSYFGIFWRIVLPLCKPALITVTIFSFMWTWDDFFAPLIYLNESRLFTVSLGLNMFADPDTMTQWGPLLAMSSLSLLPQIILFLFCQKYLVDGMATTGLK
ncbi:carbohydrate ABC transporter permease [Aquibacillus albus]|uniref:Multiple sugar transport system permease protein n=1 Tax=Aquibacillus albus TaxID=1168171 RepID=A0ABS2N3H4_9BACI|nr:carbohydrate ABC transporter permease [Aquibacillus albus]MBM7572672.1 multiple sugar transport system permease protein [Aquibacillus albus]